MTTESYIIRKESDLSIVKERYKPSFFNEYARLWMMGELMLADIFSLLAAIILAPQIHGLSRMMISDMAYQRLLVGKLSDMAYEKVFAVLALTLMLVFASKGLYPGLGFSYAEELRHIVTSTSLAFLILIGGTFLLKTTSTYSRLVLIFTWALSLVFIPAGRYLVRRLLLRLKLWGEPVVVIGDLSKALPLASYFRRMPHFGIRPVAVLRDEHCSSDDFKGYPPLPVSKIKEFAHDLSLHTALVVINDLNDVDNVIDCYRFVFQRVILIKYQCGRFGLNSLKTLDFSDVLGLQVRYNLLDFWAQVFKRIFDLIVSIFGLVMLFPILLIIAILIRLGSPGPLFYRNMCIGRGGHSFGVLKFRTMYVNSDEILKEMLEKDLALKQEWDNFHKLKNDPRITMVGKFLRKFSLDELPQLWNVLLGQMSLVGPRPMKDWEAKDYGPSFEDYLRVTPGITGLWQVSGRNYTTFFRRAQLDSEYIQRWSLWLDIYLLLKTVKVVFTREGAQ